MYTDEPPRLRSTRVPLVVGGITILMWIVAVALVVLTPVLIGAPDGMIAMMDEEWSEAGPSQSSPRPAGRRGDVIAAVAGEPSDLAARLRAAGFSDDRNLDGRRRSRSFGAWMAALRYEDEESACSVLLEGSTSTTVEFVEIEATFNERVGASEVARLIGPALSVLDPGAEPVMIVAAIHDGAGTVGRWYAERQPRDGGGMAVVLVNGQMPTALAE